MQLPEGQGDDSIALGSGARSAANGRPPLREWNATHCDFPQQAVHRLFEEQVARSPDAPAVSFGTETLSYRELNTRANQLAHYLRGRGVTTDTLVGVSMYRSTSMVVALLGTWKAGGAYVPIDPTYPQERCAFMAQDAGVHLLIGDGEARGLFRALGDRIVLLEEKWPEISRGPEHNPEGGATHEHLAYVIYTSGSTGRPKGALIEHRGLANYLSWAIRTYGLLSGDLVPVHSSISFDLTVTSLYPALLCGGQVQLLAEDLGAQNLVTALQDGRQRGLVKITPAHLELLTQQVSAAAAANTTRAFIIGGENLAAENLRFWRETAPRIRLINEYGPTETVVGCCIYEVQPGDPPNGSVPIGRPIANTELYVLDEQLAAVPVGETGELYIGGVGVGRGYLNRPELTRERFLPDPFSGRRGGRLYKTGDLARYRDDGILEYLGRVDSQIKIRGYRIELGEIEATVLGHPEVRVAAVVHREITPGNLGLVGYVVLKQAGSLQWPALQSWLRSKLPDYMVPAQYVFLEELPLTPNGKVDRKALPAPVMERAALAFEFAAPQNRTEAFLATMWAGLLHLERVGVNDDVFDLGATSLMAVTAAVAIEAELGTHVELVTLFEKPSVRLLAAALGATPAESASPPATRPEHEPAAAAMATAPSTPAAPSPAKHRVLPVRFGAAAREVLGFYHLPAESAGAAGSCLILNPFGQEAIRSHRILRLIAEHAARGGLHVLRFDYHGTGDAPGDEDAGSLEGWVQDALAADRELRRRSGSGQMVWFGLRLGATIAALASSRASDPIENLVLWEPVTDGPHYLSELAEAHAAARREFFGYRWHRNPRAHARVSEETRRESLGFPLGASLKEELGRLAVTSLSGARARRMSVVSGRTGGEAELLTKSLHHLPPADFIKSNCDVNWLINNMLADTVVEGEDIRTLLGLLTVAT